MEALEDVRHVLGGDADTGIGDPQHRLAASGGQGQPHRAGHGVLQRVAQQVEHYLLPHLPVHVGRFGERRAIHLEGQAGPLERGPEHAAQVGGERGQVDRLEVAMAAAGLDAGEIEQRVDQLAQPKPVPVDDVQVLPDGGIRVPQPGPQLLHRPHDQGERGTELMADVGEEGGLGPVQLRQFLSAPLLGPVRARAVDERRGLPGDQAHERPVVVVQAMTRAGREGQHPDRLGRRVHRQHHGLGGRLRPAPRGQLAHPAGQVVHRQRPGLAQRLGQWPARCLGRDLRPLGRAGQGESGGAALPQVQGEVGDFGLGPAQRLTDQAAGLFHGARRARLRAQVLQRSQPPGADDPLGGLGYRGEHAADGAVIVMQRAVGVRPVRLFPVAVPVHRQQQVFRPGRLAGVQHAVQHRPDDVPDVGPHVGARLVQRGVLAAHQWQVGVVIDHPEFRAPPDDHREPGGQADPGGDRAGWLATARPARAGSAPSRARASGWPSCRTRGTAARGSPVPLIGPTAPPPRRHRAPAAPHSGWLGGAARLRLAPRQTPLG